MHPGRGSFPEGRIKEDPGPHDARGSVAEWVSARGMARPPGTSRRRGAVSCPWEERADQSRNIAVLVLELVPHPSLLSPTCSTNPGDSHGQKRKQITVDGLGRNP